jgi:RNA polymerase sigma-70 factor (ECF subfamily)
MTAGDPHPPDATDADLIARWQAGDERAASLLVERHADPVARYVSSLGMRGGVEEVVQDTFVRAFGSIAAFRGESTLRTWLFTIARRLVADSRRAFRRQREVVEVQEGDAATEYDALDDLVADESRRRMHEVIGRLSPTQREVFLLRVNEGLSYKEIAGVAGTTEGAARVHYHNALRHVKESLYV